MKLFWAKTIAQHIVSTTDHSTNIRFTLNRLRQLNLSHFRRFCARTREVEVRGVIFKYLGEVVTPTAWISIFVKITCAEGRAITDDGEGQRWQDDGHYATRNFRLVEADGAWWPIISSPCSCIMSVTVESHGRRSAD